ncbi:MULTISPECIES: O-antigen ligase family protein [unclassified Mesorhizobium]|uniref:O-antigen ligase family protein n=1 Tax=unclassified Mesorhizobium TaxID=325217 RepID=UPI000FD51533|nr:MULTISPECIES: O-antigen ligase family protein [unclassified Mesorhizobium]RVB80571.1 hypothetical protein EN885_01375 [Mesorhizobium sp. M6A.T.Cr.TU.014.01.1.1]RWP97570.1 MAG: hypothetical protein EOR91_29530 [Mesorhizobium sp.]RWQ10843.1 MAG: hypothetical protein EOR90_03555 [Mesorhizobium sp.]
MSYSSTERTPRRGTEIRGSGTVAAPGRKRGLIASMYRLWTSPAAAFLFLFPTIGYYTFAAYANVVSPEGSSGGVVIRAVSLAVLVFAFLAVPRRLRRPFSITLLPATIFIVLYGSRLIENMLFLRLEISPGNFLVLSIFVLSSIIPAYMLASSERKISDNDMLALLSVLAILFIFGMALNRAALVETSEWRMKLEKINPIALAYVASSFLLFYMIAFRYSKKILIQAIFFVPVMLVIVSLARSRGVLISTGLTVLLYVLVVKGTRRVWAFVGLGVIAVAIVAFADPKYIEVVMEALNKIDADTDMSTAGRVMAFRGAWEQFLADPIFGRYAIELLTAYYPHNIYLESLMSVGLLGTVPLTLHCLISLRAAIGLLREKQAGFAGVFIALLFIRDAVGAAGSGAIWGASGFWITSFLVVSMWYGRRQDQQRVEHRWRWPSPT